MRVGGIRIDLVQQTCLAQPCALWQTAVHPDDGITDEGTRSMASIWISGPRLTGKGEPRWDVRFEGPPAPALDGKVRTRIHVGTFKTEREAKARLQWAHKEWAEGRRPDPRLIGLDPRTGRVRTLRPIVQDWIDGGHHWADTTLDQYQRWGFRIADEFPGDPASITPGDVRVWIARLLEQGYAHGTVLLAHQVLRQVLDFADCDPNPATHRSVKLPPGPGPRIRLPSRAELGMLHIALLKPWHHQVVDLLEDTGMRMLEVRRLKWHMVHDDRILVPGAKGRGGMVKPRWIDGELWPIRLFDDERGDSDAWVFPHARSLDSVSGMMGRACERAGIERYSPHDLRHLHASRLMHHYGTRRAAEIAARLGHGIGMLIDTYTHVTPPADWGR